MPCDDHRPFQEGLPMRIDKSARLSTSQSYKSFSIKSEGNQMQAAELLGISRTTLQAKLKTLGLSVSFF